MMHVRARRFAAVALAAGLTFPLELPLAAEAPTFTLEQAMADPDWIGNPPLNPYWGDDGKAVFYEQKRQGEERRDLYRIDLSSGKTEAVEPARRGEVDGPAGDLRRDRKAKVYAREGDLYFKDLATGKVRQLTRTASAEADPHFLADGKRISFYIDTDVFIYDLATGLTAQVADLRLAKNPEIDDEPTYLTEQQRHLFEVLRERKRKERQAREADRELRAADPTRGPSPFYLGEDVAIEGTVLSPSGDRLLVMTAPKRPPADRKTSKMAVWVTESGQIDVKDVRPKVGLETPRPQTLILLDLKGHTQKKLDLKGLPGIKDDPLKALHDAAKARKDAAKKKHDAAVAKAFGDPEAPEKTSEAEGGSKGADAVKKADDDAKKDDDTATMDEDAAKKDGEATDEKKEEAKASEDAKASAEGKGSGEGKGGGEGKDGIAAKGRPVEVAQVVWSDDGSRLALLLDSTDNKDRWLATCDPATGAVTPRHRQSDAAWINDGFNDLGWLRDNQSLYFLSEETGYSQLYLLDTAKAGDGATRQLTEPGPYEVSDVSPSFDRQTLYYRANREHPGTYEIYRLSLSSGKSERLTQLGGINFAALSLDEGKLLILHSSYDRPNELFLQENRPGAAATQISHTLSATFLAQAWAKPEVIPVPSTHGAPAPIYSRVYVPPGFDPARAEKYPAVIFIHGAGYLQNAHYGWSNYFHEFMFHTLLTRRGYVVLDMDYRASAGYGRAWRTAIYRQMGHPEVEDLADGVAWMAANRNVDPRRVGTYGGSYGGFLTFMALFTQPDLFAAGAALRPVSDWAHYNEGYTSNILNTPEVDPDAYAKSSPIEFAAGLTKPLLICDGMVDDNVFFLDTVRVVQRLIELKKDTFQTAIYPVEAHGFVQPTSWLDEYRRIYKLFEANLW